MRGILFKSLLITLLAVGVAFAKPFKVPKLPSKEVRKMKVSMEPPDALIKTKAFSAKLLLLEAPKTMTVTLEKGIEGGKAIYTLTNESRLNNGAKSVMTFTFLAEGNLRLRHSYLEIKSPNGKLMRKEFIDYTNPQFRYPKDMLHPMMIDVAFRSMDYTSGKKYSFDLWLTSFNVLTMDIKIKGKEKVKVPAGEFDCYKIEMLPNLEALLGKTLNRLVKPFVPKFRFWVNSKGNHQLVKSEGRMGPVAAPLQRFELISYEATP